MKSLLLYEHQELPKEAGYPDKDNMIQDLNLRVIFQAASRPVWKEGDSLKQAEKEDFFIYDTMKRIMLIPLKDAAQVLYRQRILRELVERPQLAKAMYEIGQEAGMALAQNKERGKERRGRAAAGSGELLGTFELLKRLLAELDKLKELLDGEEFLEESGLAALKCRLEKEYGEEFRKGIYEVLTDMEFFTSGGNAVFSMGLGPGLKEDRLCLKQINIPSAKVSQNIGKTAKTKIMNLFQSKQKTAGTTKTADAEKTTDTVKNGQDSSNKHLLSAEDISLNQEIKLEQGAKTEKSRAGESKPKEEKWYQKLFLSNTIQLREETEQREARLLEEAAFAYMLSYFEPLLNNLCSFFEVFQVQAAFYLGCMQLWERAAAFGAGFCFPEVVTAGGFEFTGLYELSMAILTRRIPVTNSLSEQNCWLMVITGANQGGKSTCLRSFGLAQVMLQCGMFVPAAGFCSRLYQNIYTHFTRREDATMSSGRLDEELKRMDGIIRTVTKDSLLLLNESFATTTEKEGSIIAMELVSALYEAGISVAMVTHLLSFAQKLYAKKPEHAVFLSAERKEDGTRTYRMVLQKPENTSFGLDLYDELITKE